MEHLLLIFLELMIRGGKNSEDFNGLSSDDAINKIGKQLSSKKVAEKY